MENYTIYEGILLDDSMTYTLTEVTTLSHIEAKIIIEMVEYGIAEPIGVAPEKWRFNHQALLRFKKAVRLHRDLNINWPGVSLALDLIDERNELHTLLRTMQQGE